MTFEQANLLRESIDSTLRTLSRQLQTFPRGPMGLTPDSVKQSAEYRTISVSYQYAHRMYRDFNAWFIPTFENEYREWRKARRESRAA